MDNPRQLFQYTFRALVDSTVLIPGSEPNSIRASVLIMNINEGVLKVGDTITLKSRLGFPLTVLGIELDGTLVLEAHAGQAVGVLFNGIDLSSILAGDEAMNLLSGGHP